MLALIYGLFVLRGTPRRILLFVLAVCLGFYCAVLILRAFGVDGVPDIKVKKPVPQPSLTQTGVTKNKAIRALPM